ncbi:MAG TPA: hypothetical protein VHX11_10640 [Acidobacteriaceae bacterium]|nr:hypothetical protein [Acidobacteriaceae bacterium]
MGTLEGVNRPLSVVLGILLIGVVAYLVYEYRADFGMGGAGTGPGSGSPAWQTVDRSADGFTVKMPSAPSETEIPAYTDHGVVEQVPMIEATIDAANGEPASTYAVAWADNPPVEQAAGQDPEKTLDMARDGALGRTQTSLVSESHREIDGHESREFVGRNASGGILNGRLILAGTHLYMLIATFPGTEEWREEDVNRFFESFKLTGAGATAGGN